MGQKKKATIQICRQLVEVAASEELQPSLYSSSDVGQPVQKKTDMEFMCPV